MQVISNDDSQPARHPVTKISDLPDDGEKGSDAGSLQIQEVITKGVQKFQDVLNMALETLNPIQNSFNETSKPDQLKVSTCEHAVVKDTVKPTADYTMDQEQTLSKHIGSKSRDHHGTERHTSVKPADSKNQPIKEAERIQKRSDDTEQPTCKNVHQERETECNMHLSPEMESCIDGMINRRFEALSVSLSPCNTPSRNEDNRKGEEHGRRTGTEQMAEELQPSDRQGCDRLSSSTTIHGNRHQSRQEDTDIQYQEPAREDRRTQFQTRVSTPPLNLSSSSGMSPLPSEAFIAMLDRSLRIGRTPPPTPLTFSGDPMEYVSWRRSISHLMEQGVNESEKLTYLQQYLSETVRKSVKAYLQDEKSASSTKILKELDARYGDQYMLAQSYLEELNNWPNIKDRDPAALRQPDCNNRYTFTVSEMPQRASPGENIQRQAT
jgi:hypothetical protein